VSLLTWANKLGSGIKNKITARMVFLLLKQLIFKP